MRTLGAIPSYYLHYFYCTDHAVQAQTVRAPPGPKRCSGIERTLLEMYADPALDTKPELLDSAAARTTARRPPRWSRHCSPVTAPTTT